MERGKDKRRTKGTDRGQNEDTRTDRQTCTMISIIDEVLNYAPDILVAGHNQFSAKACPSFSVPAFCRSNGIEEKNIYQENPYNYKL